MEQWSGYLQQRWAQGCRDATVLYHELRKQGYTRSKELVQRYVRRWRKELAAQIQKLSELPDLPPPSPRKTVWLLLKDGTDRSEQERAFTKEIVRISPQVGEALGLVQEFRRMVRDRDGAVFEKWLEHVGQSGVSELRSFAKGLEVDLPAVRAALTCEWSSGQVEGHVNRLKVIKRQMYGRAKFDLLRARVLYGT